MIDLEHAAIFLDVRVGATRPKDLYADVDGGHGRLPEFFWLPSAARLSLGPPREFVRIADALMSSDGV